VIETSEPQASTTAAAFAAEGLDPKIAISEEMEATVVIGTTPAR
jgi:release factor glutamine methyltransferase